MATYGGDPPEGWTITSTGILTAPTEVTNYTTSNNSIPPGSYIAKDGSGNTYEWKNGTSWVAHPYQPPPQPYTQLHTYVPPPVYSEGSKDEHPIVPLFADAITVRAALQRQLLVLESLEEDGLVGPLAELLADAIFFLKETMEALEKISGEA